MWVDDQDEDTKLTGLGVCKFDVLYVNAKTLPAQPIVCGPIEAINEFVVKPKDNQAILDPVAQKQVCCSVAAFAD